jgi:hypothetical protein|tara:strand:- start:24291 stop:24662 length:372 start_codon:yes stop_codon:yes gene_type:complete
MSLLATSLVGNVSKILDKFVSDKDLKSKLESDLISSITEIDKAQAQINLQDAKSSSLFQSMWRPTLCWVLVLSFSLQYFFSPILAIFDIDIPQADMSVMMPVLFGVLGLGTLRTYELKTGVKR